MIEEEGSPEIDSTERVRQTLADINEIFVYWRVRMGHPRACLDQKRRSKIRQRLCDGYKKQDLLDAIEGCALSTFHMGQNDRSTVYNDIELICRDAKHVDQFLKVHETHKAKKAQAAARVKAEAEERARLDRERAERARHFRESGGPIPFKAVR